MVSGPLVLIGKAAFLAVLYGFLFVAYRGLMAEARRGGRRRPPAAKAPEAAVAKWELRAPAARRVTLRPANSEGATVSPPVQIDPQAKDDAPSEASQEAAGNTTETVIPEPESTDEVVAGETAPAADANLPALEVVTSPEVDLRGGLRIPVGDATTVGRGEDNDIVLEDRFVSSHHAEITRGEDGYSLRDLGSTNGTFYNGARVVGAVSLHEGDRVGIGTSAFIFREGDPG